MADLLINGEDALLYGVRMGDGFLDAIDGLLSLKDPVSNTSRLENGKRVITSAPKIDERDITLAFTITGKSENDFRSKKKAFLTTLYKGNVNIEVPALGNEVYKLIYTKSVSYGLSLNRCFCHLSAKFNEPNPADRSATT